MSLPGSSAAWEFPRRYALTARFTAGVPRDFSVSPDGAAVLFLRSRSGRDATGLLWALDVESMRERCLADPGVLVSSEEVPEDEAARRERSREASSGITAYALDRAWRRAVFALSGRLFLVDLPDALHGERASAPSTERTTVVPRELAGRPAAVDPRLSPDGALVSYVSGGELRVLHIDSADDRALASPQGPGQTWGLADFAASEELGRHRGHWWSPTSERVLVASVDETAVLATYIADPARPETPPRLHRYPRAGTPNARVGLRVLDMKGSATEVTLDTERWEYLAGVSWTGDRPVCQVLSRDQREAAVLAIDAGSGRTSILRGITDDAWVDVVPGAPTITDVGQLLTVERFEGRHCLLVDGRPVSPAGAQVRRIVEGGPPWLVEVTDSSNERHVWRLEGDHLEPVSVGGGVHSAVAGGPSVVVSSADLSSTQREHHVVRSGVLAGNVRSLAELPGIAPRVELLACAGIPTALVLPSWHRPGAPALPVLMDPYGGPSASRVVPASGAFLVSAWFAEMGFGVVIADGRGTPGTPEWERAVLGDLAGPALDDQVSALTCILACRPELDGTRVAVRGWSFGGFLAALAVLRRPDLFHAGIAGAPPTDFRLYDTAYSERYLGCDPEGADAAAYERSSLLGLAGGLRRPLLLLHGLSDDNVLVANSLRLSAALMAAGRPHSLLALPGVTHMASQHQVSENVLRLELDFLRRSL